MPSAPNRAWVVCILLATSVSGCATTAPRNAPVADKVTPAPTRTVQTIRLEPSHVDGQTSWIIEPDVPRIPKIHGVEPQLPPHIEQRLSRAFDLAQRGATYSANSEFREVLALCALELDARNNLTTHRDALHQGLLALDEADEISGQRIDWSDMADVRLVTAGHSTPVLHNGVPAGIDSIQAVQLYYSFAEERFAYACQEMPGASLAYYGLARTFVQPGTRYTHAAGKAAMLQRVALRIEPKNVLAGNELGVLLAQHGHLNEAESLFEQCVATDATPEAWQNLSVVYARKGDVTASRAALSAGSKLAASHHAMKPLAPAAASSDATVDAGTARVTTEMTKKPDSNNVASEVDENQQGIWAKLNLSQRIPNVFRR